MQKSEHKWRQEEEVKLLRGGKKKKTLKKEECDGVLNIQPLVVRSHRINHHLQNVKKAKHTMRRCNICRR